MSWMALSLPTGGVAILLYPIAGPIVHWSHGHAAKGFASLGVRLGVPIGSALVAGLLGTGIARVAGADALEAEDAGLVAGLITFLVSWPAAMVVDAAVLAKEPVPARTDGEDTGSVTVVPTFFRNDQRTTFGLVGSF